MLPPRILDMTAKTSLVWEYFERSTRNGADYSRCKIDECGDELSGHRATNAKRHLQAVHNIDVDALDKERQLTNPTTTAALKAQLNDLRQTVGIRVACNLAVFRSTF